MDITVREHITRLEQRLELLNEEIMCSNLSLEQRNKIESEIRALNLVLTHYRSALKIENAIGR